ncbi:hypothetical protein Y032_0187g1131 [Ancylostoma ceylanicum]|uniref:Uncharacterized protein n=1 Tax=Ancylostoma ceylanicum TaxID=53326 RepID=A0A016SQV1_9BILA|nr:hypothetical protein Y032_0187g1131 [Ancylostoma ceylanicum]
MSWPSKIESLQVKWISQFVNLMVTVHVLPTIIIMFSPLAQQVEEWAAVPPRQPAMGAPKCNLSDQTSFQPHKRNSKASF